MNIDIVLASGSPRRRELLQGLGWNFKVIVPEVDETPIPGESPPDLCRRLSSVKVMAVAAEPDSLVVAADTIVVVDGQVLGKPAGHDECLEMLKLLQGREHEVFTGISLRWRGQVVTSEERTLVRFRPLRQKALHAYAETGEGLDKAGAYAIQGRGALLISGISGDYFNVVGLPLNRLSLMLEEMGIPLTVQWGYDSGGV